MERLEEIRERAKGITGKMPDANKAEIHRRDCVALLSLIDKYELQAELFEQFKTERKEMIELMVSKGLISPDQYLEVVNQVLYRKE